jgi:hypothetical protein
MAAEALLAAGYALFLVAAAVLLDLGARHTHNRSLRYRTAGFRYHEHLDAWECPEGQHLWPDAVDEERRLVRYRAKAHICNVCALKPACTDSDDGREIVRLLDPWFRTEAGRFHRVLALTLLALAALVAAAGLARNHTGAEIAVLAGALVMTAAAASRLMTVSRPSARARRA